MRKELRAFHGDPEVRAKYIERVEAHRAADEIIHGIYWEHGKGCAVGCTIHSSDHFAYEKKLGIPAPLAFLEDQIFESMGNGRAKDWPVEFLTAIPLGADLSQVVPQFLAWLMVDPTWGVEHTTDDAEIKELCREVARRYRAGETTGAEADALAERLRAAWDAWAARAARDAWAARAALAALAAWDARAARAAWAALAARAARDAWAATYQKFVGESADELLGLLRGAPVPTPEQVAV